MKKKRDTKNIIFIDASKDYIKNGHSNKLSEDNITKITETYYNRTEIEKFSHIATIDEIISNNYNLTTKMYVDTYEKMEINIEETRNNLKTIRQKIKKNDEKLHQFFKDKENIFGF